MILAANLLLATFGKTALGDEPNVLDRVELQQVGMVGLAEIGSDAQWALASAELSLPASRRCLNLTEVGSLKISITKADDLNQLRKSLLSSRVRPPQNLVLEAKQEGFCELILVCNKGRFSLVLGDGFIIRGVGDRSSIAYQFYSANLTKWVDRILQDNNCSPLTRQEFDTLSGYRLFQQERALYLRDTFHEKSLVDRISEQLEGARHEPARGNRPLDVSLFPDCEKVKKPKMTLESMRWLAFPLPTSELPKLYTIKIWWNGFAGDELKIWFSHEVTDSISIQMLKLAIDRYVRLSSLTGTSGLTLVPDAVMRVWSA